MPVRKNMIYTITALFLLFAITGKAFASEDYLSIQDLYTQDLSWNETYQTNRNETVTVAIDSFSIPNATAFPVLQVEAAEPVSTDLLTQYEQEKAKDWTNVGLNNSDGVFGIGINIRGFYPAASDRYICDFPVQELDINAVQWDQAYAECNSLTLAQAYSISQALLSYYFGDSLDPQLVGVNLCGRLRQYNTKTNEFGDVLGERGSYEFGYHQQFNEIQITFHVTSTFRTKVNEIASEWGLGNSFIETNIMDNDTYGMQAQVKELVDTVYPDVPLCSFDTVKSSVEPLILTGLIRNIYSVQLAYVTYQDKNDNTILWALPTWIIECSYFETSLQEPTVSDLIYESRGNTSSTTYHQNLFVNAQTGVLVDPMAGDDDRSFVPDIILW